jgi:peptidoglycan/xylan/chitin deacetylase (PgdA/CDA1 family)
MQARLQPMIEKARNFLTRRQNRGKLAVLGYHRVGDFSSTAWDPMLFTATAADLDRHITFLKKDHRIVGLDEALAIAAGHEKTKTTSVLLTFDDGYLDNFEAALPVLKAHFVSAVFFLVSGFLERKIVPWWDQIAWMCRRAQRSDGAAWIDRYKNPNINQSEFWAELESATQLSRPSDPGGLFLNPGQARVLLAAGMSIGAHTCTHPILAQLGTVEQQREIAESKSLLEAQLGTRIDTFAYPVGSRDAFTGETVELLRASGYRAAFSYYGGINTPGNVDPFDLKRIPVYRGVPNSDLLRES